MAGAAAAEESGPLMPRAHALRGKDALALHARYESGEITMAMLAKEVGVTPTALRSWFARKGLPTSLHASAGKLEGVDLTDAHRRYMRGEPSEQIAAALGVGAGALIYAFHRAKLPTFRRGASPNSRNAERRKKPAGNQAGTWTVLGAHEHVIAQGVCLICDRAVASA